MKYPLKLSPLSEQGFGGVIDVDESAIFYQSTQENPEWLSEAMDISDGLLLIKGLSDIVEYPERLVELSYLFGNEVENYLDTPTPRNMIHNDVGEILVISNRPLMIVSPRCDRIRPLLNQVVCPCNSPI